MGGSRKRRASKPADPVAGAPPTEPTGAANGDHDPHLLPFPDEYDAWRAEALAEQPDPHDWAQLVALLRWGSEMERRGINNPEFPSGMTAIEYAVSAVLAFLQHQDCLMRHNSIAPILRLLGAIIDLADGRISPLFKPVKRRGGYPGKTLAETAVIGVAARALSELIREGVPPQHAARQVASAIRAGHAAGFRKTTAETVKNWRARCMEGAGAVPPNALAHYSEPLPPGLNGKLLLSALKQARPRGWG